MHYLLCTYYKYSYVGLCSKWRKIWESLAEFWEMMRSRELSRSAGSVRLPSFAMHWGCFAKRHFLILYFLVVAHWLTFPKSDNGSRQNPNTNTWQSFWDLHLGGVPYTSSISIKLCINQGHCCRRWTPGHLSRYLPIGSPTRTGCPTLNLPKEHLQVQTHKVELYGI